MKKLAAVEGLWHTDSGQPYRLCGTCRPTVAHISLIPRLVLQFRLFWILCLSSNLEKNCLDIDKLKFQEEKQKKYKNIYSTKKVNEMRIYTDRMDYSSQNVVLLSHWLPLTYLMEVSENIMLLAPAKEMVLPPNADNGNCKFSIPL